MSKREHKLNCNEMHQHISPECCTLDCWCIVEAVAEILQDNKERIANRHCSNCKFFVQSGTLTLRKIDHNKITNTNVSSGKCRRHAPVMRSWPAVTGDDWCGNFEPNRIVEVS